MLSSMKACMKQHPVLAYYALVFAISWLGIVIALGPGGFLGITASAQTQLWVGGPISLLGPSAAGLIMTGLLYGKPGLRALGARFLRWRVGAGWYAFALLTAPVITLVSLLVRSTLPAIVATSDKLGLLLMGIGIGVGSSPIFEELGWTGFVTPELRKRFGVLATGLMMGVLWGLWHYPIFSASGRASDPLSPVLFTLALLFTWLIPYRVLLVWLYDRTQSVLLVVLMHVVIVTDQFVLSPEKSSTTFIAVSNVMLAVGLWIMVAVILVADRARLAARTSTAKLPA